MRPHPEEREAGKEEAARKDIPSLRTAPPLCAQLHGCSPGECQNGRKSPTQRVQGVQRHGLDETAGSSRRDKPGGSSYSSRRRAASAMGKKDLGNFGSL